MMVVADKSSKQEEAQTGSLRSLLGRPPRVLVTKIGLDGHDRGSRIVAGFLRDAGMEVIYTAPWQSIDTVVIQAVEEDVDAVGISSLATDHLLLPKLMNALRDADLHDVVVVVGGIVPDDEIPLLTDAGVMAVFHPGSSREEIVSTLSSLITEYRCN